MSFNTVHQSEVPLELIDGIAAGCNADDVKTLQAMCLASKTMRFSALRFLFSEITLFSVEDFHTWFDMLARTPALGLFVKLEFCVPPSEVLQETVSMPVTFPRCPHRSLSVDVPNMTALHISAAFRNFEEASRLLGTCSGKLETLSLAVQVDIIGQLELTSQPQLDLTGLERLIIPYATPETFLVGLLDHPSPVGLKSLEFGTEIPCPILFEKALALGAHSLQHLIVYPSHAYLEKLRHLTSSSFTSWIDGRSEISAFVNALSATPNMATLVFRIVFHRYSEHGPEFLRNNIIQQWEQLAKDVERKFPQLGRLIIQFLASQRWRGSGVAFISLHDRANIRQTIETLVRERVIGTLRDRLLLEWLVFEWRQNEAKPAAYDASGMRLR
ncbi:hypothetical protein DFH07DRAFT_832601 [Mycena maculata]|uniref:Uncharacterized protein n=1 Tax=Mycena maculata TaxID=230809 RepID=A0AAD7INW4_9AGAR|nr:hypothetical protein DFH07DRAFT_832601 [Mycena maculata]